MSLYEVAVGPKRQLQNLLLYKATKPTNHLDKVSFKHVPKCIQKYRRKCKRRARSRHCVGSRISAWVGCRL